MPESHETVPLNPTATPFIPSKSSLNSPINSTLPPQKEIQTILPPGAEKMCKKAPENAKKSLSGEGGGTVRREKALRGRGGRNSARERYMYIYTEEKHFLCTPTR